MKSIFFSLNLLVNTKRIKWIARIGMYLLGLVIMALSAVLFIRANLGMSSIMCMPYVVSIITGISFGTASIGFFVLMILLQIGLNGWKLTWEIGLQLPFTLFMGKMADLISSILVLNELGMYQRIILFCFSAFLTAIGVSLVLSMRLVPVAPDGFVLAVVKKVKNLSFGSVKVRLDILFVLITVVLGLIFKQAVIGVGVGTILIALTMGKIIDKVSTLLKKSVIIIID